MTTRRWWAVAALVGVLVWSGQAVARWHRYRNLAQYHATELANLNVVVMPALEFRDEMGYFPGCALGQLYLEQACDKAEWHRRLKSKYERAATRHWLSVEPDPPAPEP
jgi:hypothetical protein